MSHRLDSAPSISMSCHHRPSTSLHMYTPPIPLEANSPHRRLLQHPRAASAHPTVSTAPVKSSIRNLTTQLFQREIGRRPLTITRQHINSFRRNLTMEIKDNGEAVPRRLTKRQQDSLEFLRALFCCTHLRASFERLSSSHGDVLTQQVDTFLKMLKEPCPDDVTSSISEGGHQLRTAVRRKAAFFEHLWRLGISRFVVHLLMVDSARLSPKLVVRNKALCLRLIRRLGRRTLCQFGSRLLRVLSEDFSFVRYCFKLMSHQSLTEEAVILLEDVFHHRRQEMPLCHLSEMLSQTLLELRVPHLVAKVMRLLALMCSPTKLEDGDDRVWPTDGSKLVKPTAISDANQLLLLTQVPNFLSQLMEVLDAGVMGSLPRTRFNQSLEEEAHWFDWLDSQDSLINKVRTQQGPFVRAAVSKVVSVVDLMESAMLLRILLLGPHSEIIRKKLLTKFGIASRLCRYMDRLLWNDAELSLQDDGLAEPLDLRPETPLKLQIVRCISALFESCSPSEKRLFHSKAELTRLRALAEFLPPDERDPSLFSVGLKLCCQGGSGLLTRLAFALMQQPKLSTFRLWLSKCIESYLLDLQYPLADQQLLALIELPSATLDLNSVTLLEDQISQSFLHTKFTIGDTITIQNTDVAGGLSQEMRVQACDTLAALIKFNVSTSCLFLTSVWDVVRKSSETTINVSLSYSEQEKLASALMVNYFKFYKVISNVLLRAFAVTEAASLQKDDMAFYSSNPCFPECNDISFPNAYDVCGDNVNEAEMFSTMLNSSSNKAKRMKLKIEPTIIDAGPSFVVVTKILAEMVYNLIMAINPSYINQSNVSCLNTSIVICVLKYRQHNLADFLVDVQAFCKNNKQDLNRFRSSLETMLSIWMDAYISKTPKCLKYLASTWRMSVSEIRRIVSVILEDLRTNRFPFINHNALVELWERKQNQSNQSLTVR